MSGRYQSYTDYRNSEVEWIDRYPSDWVLAKVKFESYVKARVGWHGLKSDDFTDEGPFLITGSDFNGKNIDWQNCYHCDEERYKQDPYIQLKEGDLLITKDGTIGKVALVNDLKGKATLNSGVFVVRPLMGNYSTSFYYWLLQSAVFTGFVDYNKTGSTIVHLYQDTFVNFMYASPSLPEQEVIANFLDHETAKIDTLIDKQQQLIKLLKEKRQAVISHAVTKGLNPAAPMKDSGVEWLGEVPEHWVVAKLKYFADIQGGFAFSSDSFLENGVQLLRIGNVYQNRLDLSRQPIFIDHYFKESHKEYVVTHADILMSLTGTLGKRDYGFAVRVEENDMFMLNQRLAKLLPKSEKITNDFLLHSIWSNTYLDPLYLLPSGTKQANLSNENVLNINVAVPPGKAEQDRINLFLKENLSRFNDILVRSEKAIELLSERRTALISAAVTGKIDVRNWQPAQTVTPMEASA